jgi:predicted SAM-dependent methyltransferase
MSSNKGRIIKSKFKKLNIGCGYNKKEGFVNIDKAKEVKPDEIVNIEKGFPFPDNSFEYIYSEHTLEHIEPQNWRFVLNEIARIAKKGCILELKLPYDNSGQRTNADHFRTFSWNSFDQFSEESKRNYYSNLHMKRLYKIPNKFVKLFFYLFPFLKYEVHLKFEIIKK